MGTTTIKNSIFTISPYRYYGGWVFDDPKVGLDKEAFVAGADTLLDKLSEGRDRVVVMFSDIVFPDHQLRLDKVHKTNGTSTDWGTDYYCEQLQHHLWLCPALNLYYPISPNSLYLKVK